jgi:hypothetical protein
MVGSLCVSRNRGENRAMKYWIGARVRLSEEARMRLVGGGAEAGQARVARENRTGVVIQWIGESMQPTGYLVDFQGVYMALGEEDVEAVE